MNKKSNILLIGMPGSGKSTVGIILAKMLNLQFVDTDLLIQKREDQTLQNIVNSFGHMRLRQIEEEVLLSIGVEKHIIATGGSAAYSEPAMIHLKQNSTTIFLHADLPTLTSRINNYENRGLAKREDQTFQDLFEERYALYLKYADITIESSGKSQEIVCDEIAHKLSKGYSTETDTSL